MRHSALGPLLATAQIGIAFAVALVARRVVRPPAYLHRAFLCALVFQNSSALPLIIARGLAGADGFAALAIHIFLYNVGWQTTFWTFGAAYLQGDEESAATDSSVLAPLRKGMRQPMLIASFVGITIGLAPPLQSALFDADGVLHSMGQAAEVLAAAGVPVVTCVIAGTLGKSLLRNSAALLSAWRGAPAAAEGESALSLRVIFMLCFCRLVVVGAIQFAGTSAIFAFVFPDADPLMKLAVLLECCVPSANMVIVTLQTAGKKVAAEELSVAYIIMYVASLLTMTPFLIGALKFSGVEGGD